MWSRLYMLLRSMLALGLPFQRQQGIQLQGIVGLDGSFVIQQNPYPRAPPHAGVMFLQHWWPKHWRLKQLSQRHYLHMSATFGMFWLKDSHLALEESWQGCGLERRSPRYHSSGAIFHLYLFSFYSAFSKCSSWLSRKSSFTFRFFSDVVWSWTLEFFLINYLFAKKKKESKRYTRRRER